MSKNFGLNSRRKWIVTNTEGKVIINIGFVGKGSDGQAVHQAIKSRNKKSLVIGVDIDETMMLSIHEPNSVVGSVASLPIKQHSVDMVVMGELIEHFFDLESIIQNITSILKPGGQIIITSPNPYHPFRHLKHWFFKPSSKAGSQANVKDYLGFYDHKIFWDPLSVANMLGVHGYKVIELTTKGVVIPYIDVNITSSWENNFWPFNKWGSNFCLKAVLAMTNEAR